MNILTNTNITLKEFYVLFPSQLLKISFLRTKYSLPFHKVYFCLSVHSKIEEEVKDDVTLKCFF